MKKRVSKQIRYLDISGFVNNLNNKMKKLATKEELKAEQRKLLKFQTFHLDYFFGKNFVINDGTQNYLIFSPLGYILKTLSRTEKILSWKSRVYWLKELLLQLLVIIVFPQQLNAMEIQNVIHYLKEDA